MKWLSKNKILLGCLVLFNGYCFALGENIGALNRNFLASAADGQRVNLSCDKVDYTPLNSGEELHQMSFDENDNYWIIGTYGLYFFESQSNQAKYSYTFHKYGRGVAVVDQDTLAISSGQNILLQAIPPLFTLQSWLQTYSISKMQTAAKSQPSVNINIDIGWYYWKQTFNYTYSGSAGIADIYHIDNSVYAFYAYSQFPLTGRTIYQWQYNPATTEATAVGYLNQSGLLNYNSYLTQHGKSIIGVGIDNKQLVTCSNSECSSEAISVDGISKDVPLQPLYIQNKFHIVNMISGEIYLGTATSSPKYVLLSSSDSHPINYLEQVVAVDKLNTIFALAKGGKFVYKCKL